MSELLGVLFLALFIVAAALCIYLSITMSRRLQAGIVRWRTEERQALEAELRNLAEFDARLRFEQWKNEHEQEIQTGCRTAEPGSQQREVDRAYRALSAGLRSRSKGRSLSWHANRPDRVQWA